MLTGVEITSAQGQAMISSASARWASNQGWLHSSGGTTATSTATPTTTGV